MMIMPNPGVLDQIVRERQHRLRLSAQASATSTGLRIRIGHALIAIGAGLSGERVERVEQPGPAAALQTAC
jgi:hypothetical protein